MRILLDTCAVIALSEGTLSGKAADVLRAAPEAVVSIVSPWEIGIKCAKGRIKISEPLAVWFERLVRRFNLRVLPLDSTTVIAAAALPMIHRDPFDRVLVATALAHRLTILTSDSKIAAYPGIRTFW